MNHRENVITLTTPDPSRIEVECAPHPQKLVPYLCPRSQNAVALGAPDDGKVVSILRDVHEDGSAGHAFELATDVFVWHRAQPCQGASVLLSPDVRNGPKCLESTPSVLPRVTPEASTERVRSLDPLK
jgi:hypothetical protein